VTLTNTIGEARPQGLLRRAIGVAGDMFGTVAVVLCVPLVILAIGLPFALLVRLLLWIFGIE